MFQFFFFQFSSNLISPQNSPPTQQRPLFPEIVSTIDKAVLVLAMNDRDGQNFWRSLTEGVAPCVQTAISWEYLLKHLSKCLANSEYSFVDISQGPPDPQKILPVLKGRITEDDLGIASTQALQSIKTKYKPYFEKELKRRTLLTKIEYFDLLLTQTVHESKVATLSRFGQLVDTLGPWKTENGEFLPVLDNLYNLCRTGWFHGFLTQTEA